MVRQCIDDFGMTRKQAQEFMSHSIKLPEAERFDDVDDIIKDFGAYE